jgi:phage anti-repressor protein
MLNEFSIELATLLHNSDEKFPVDFDSAWVWLGYFDKPTAKRSLLGFDFVVDVDFCINAGLCSASNPRPTEHITLTVDCFKTWGMLAGTDRGKQVRKYFLECERIAKSKLTKSVKSQEDKQREWLDYGYSLAEKAMLSAGLPKALASQVGVAGVIKAAPHLNEQLQPVMQALINSTASSDELLNVTQLGKELGLSAKATNKLLIEKGYQVPNSKKTSARDLNYTPTELGERYSQVVQSADGNGRTFQQLRWNNQLCKLV